MADVRRVVIVNDFGKVNGGADRVAITSARALAEHGIEVSFLCGAGPVSGQLDHPRIDVRCLGLRDVWSRGNQVSAALAAIWNAEAGRKLGRLLRQIEPAGAVVHVHQWTKVLSPSAIHAVRNAGLPCLLSMHDYFLACPNGSYFSFSHGRPCAYRPMSLACVCANCDSRSYAHKGVRLVRQVALGRTAKAETALNVIHVSPFARTIAEPLLPAGWRHFVVANPVDVAQRPPVEVEHNRAFVFIGRFTPEKQPVQLAEAARRAGVPATFLGEGPEGDRIRATYPGARVLPWGDAAAVEAVLQDARALVFPSSWYETNGLVVAEALARGVPAIVSRTAGARDLIQDGVNGLLLPPGELPALVSCIETLRSDQTVRRMGRNAFELYWREPLSGSLHVDRLVKVYDAVLDGDRARGT